MNKALVRPTNDTTIYLMMNSEFVNELSDGDESDQPDVRKLRDKSKKSKAPLHLAYDRIKSPTQRVLDDLLAQGFTYNRGKFTKEENKRLKKNWKRFIRAYPQYNDPCLAFGLGTRDLQDIQKKRDFRCMKIIERMGYKLEDRLLYDIYLRCRSLFAFKKYTHSTMEDLTLELREKIAQKLDNTSNLDLSREFDVCPDTVRKLRQNPEPAKRRHHWTESDINSLVVTVENEAKCGKEISWSRVSKLMKEQYGLNLNREQCYKKWARLQRSRIQNGASRDQECKIWAFR